MHGELTSYSVATSLHCAIRRDRKYARNSDDSRQGSPGGKFRRTWFGACNGIIHGSVTVAKVSVALTFILCMATVRFTTSRSVKSVKECKFHPKMKLSLASPCKLYLSLSCVDRSRLEPCNYFGTVKISKGIVADTFIIKMHLLQRVVLHRNIFAWNILLNILSSMRRLLIWLIIKC